MISFVTVLALSPKSQGLNLPLDGQRKNEDLEKAQFLIYEKTCLSEQPFLKASDYL